MSTYYIIQTIDDKSESRVGILNVNGQKPEIVNEL